MPALRVLLCTARLKGRCGHLREGRVAGLHTTHHMQHTQRQGARGKEQVCQQTVYIRECGDKTAIKQQGCH